MSKLRCRWVFSSTSASAACITAAHAQLVDAAHVVDLYAQGVDEARRVHAAHANQRDLLRLQAVAAPASCVGQRLMAEQGRPPACRAGCRWVRTPACWRRHGQVEPQHLQPPGLCAAVVRHGADGANGQAMVATHQQRQPPGLQRGTAWRRTPLSPAGDLDEMAKLTRWRRSGYPVRSTVCGPAPQGSGPAGRALCRRCAAHRAPCWSSSTLAPTSVGAPIRVSSVMGDFSFSAERRRSRSSISAPPPPG